MLGGNPKQLQTFLEKFDVLMKETFTDNGGEFMFQSVIGALFERRSHDKNDLSNNFVGWSVDSYVAMKLGPLAERYLALHQFLVKSGATASKSFDFEHCDRYGVAYADEEDFKTMAIQCQSFTYIVMLVKRRSWPADKDDTTKADAKTVWGLHIRYCTTAGYDSWNYARTEFKTLTWLKDREKCYPDIGYGKNTQDYFRYKDCRDRGYCISIEPDFVYYGDVQTYRAEHAMLNYKMLEGIVFDLASHCDCIEDYEESLTSD